MLRLRILATALLFTLAPISGMAQGIDLLNSSGTFTFSNTTIDGPGRFNGFPDKTHLLFDTTSQGVHQDVACTGAVTRDGKGVKGAKVRYELYSVDQFGNRTLLSRQVRRSNRSGQVKPLEFDVSFLNDDTYEVDIDPLGGKKADTFISTCRHADMGEVCPGSVCFGPDDRFLLQCVDDPFFFNSPDEIENGRDERWNFDIEDRCPEAGTMTLSARRTVGAGGTIPNGITILDTKTGIVFDPNASFDGGFGSGDTTVIHHPGVCP